MKDAIVGDYIEKIKAINGGKIMFSIGKLCREFSLSRSTLLYYDDIGLLIASQRTQSNYRQYSEDDKKRLGQICSFREAGVPLCQIKSMLDSDAMAERSVLEERIDKLNKEIRYKRFQQKLVVEMLKAKNLTDKEMPMDREIFTATLKSAGFDAETMSNIHIQFEKNSPDSHKFFLEFLGIPEEEIKNIRRLCRQK